MKSGEAVGLFVFSVIAITIFFLMATRPAMNITAVQFGMPVNSVISAEKKPEQEGEIKEIEQQVIPEDAPLEPQEALDSVESDANNAQ